MKKNIILLILIVILYDNLTYITSDLLSLFLPVESNYIIVSESYKLVINDSCNGGLIYGMFLILGIYYQFQSFLITEILILFLINIIRIAIIYWIVLYNGREYFFIAHDILGYGMVIITFLILFIYNMKNEAANKKWLFLLAITRHELI